MSDLDLKKLAELEKNSTPGDWRVDDYPACDEGATQHWVANTYQDGLDPLSGVWINSDHNTERLAQSKTNAELITALRNNAKELIAKARRSDILEKLLREAINDENFHEYKSRLLPGVCTDNCLACCVDNCAGCEVEAAAEPTTEDNP